MNYHQLDAGGFYPAGYACVYVSEWKFRHFFFVSVLVFYVFLQCEFVDADR